MKLTGHPFEGIKCAMHKFYRVGAGERNRILISGIVSLSGSGPTLGSAPAGSNLSISTNTVGLVNLQVATTVNTTPANLSFSVAGGVLQIKLASGLFGLAIANADE